MRAPVLTAAPGFSGLSAIVVIQLTPLFWESWGSVQRQPTSLIFKSTADAGANSKSELRSEATAKSCTENELTSPNLITAMARCSIIFDQY